MRLRTTVRTFESATVIASDPRARHINYDWMEPARQVRVRIDQDEARQLGFADEVISKDAEKMTLEEMKKLLANMDPALQKKLLDLLAKQAGRKNAPAWLLLAAGADPHSRTPAGVSAFRHSSSVLTTFSAMMNPFF